MKAVSHHALSLKKLAESPSKKSTRFRARAYLQSPRSHSPMSIWTTRTASQSCKRCHQAFPRVFQHAALKTSMSRTLTNPLSSRLTSRSSWHQFKRTKRSRQGRTARRVTSHIKSNKASKARDFCPSRSSKARSERRARRSQRK